ncbi:thioredoxin family protein [Aeromonas veronii]|uniref:protein-disulfide reductase DsbD family protein n=1 Tax=Aeromonas TaxID=642 RepID=UPI0022EB015D|nr:MULTISPECIES: protein-disulfide reductase DsbD domain-containing protein [Aeromonas]KAJ8739764.1 thioredoxin family protein [Aeromonas veronii]MDA3317611.1 thioredoxin family protein [Aeromonas sp. PI_26]
MSNLFKAALLLGGLLWQSMGLASDTGWLTSPQNDHARVRLQADRSTADQTRILLDVELESGWKTYWHSPGEGGIAPQTLWDEPVGDFQWHWPVPRHFEVAGLSTQGYQGEVTFPLSLNYPAGQPLKGTLRLSTCSNVCILTDFPFTLAVDSAAPADFDFAWAKAMSTLPQQLPAETRVELGYQHNQLQLRAERAEGWQSPALFIDALEGAEFGKPALEVEGNTLIARVPVSDGWQGDAPDLRGQSLGLLLTSGEQAWQAKGSIGEALALPAPSQPLFWLLGATLLGGLILNLMPCVLPVLALKLGSVLQHQEREQGAVRKQFLAASAGIIASFWVLAAMSSLLRATQGAVGWGIQFQSAGFIGLMVLVTLLFCANLLGLFEIRLPSALSTRLATSGGNGLGGHFLQGSFATLLATPCSAPFLGTAVAFALVAPLGQLWLIFTALGIGMSLPWLLVAALPRLALWLPKPGRWMNHLRILLGLMMLGSSLWLTSLLDNHLGSYATGWLMAAMLLALLAGIIWRYGMRGFTLAIALTALIGSPLLLSGAFSAQGSASVDKVVWQPLSERAITDALAQNKRVFIDVTADWCVTCKANKYNVLLRDEVQQALSAPDVVALRGDWSKPSDTIAAFLRKRGAAAVPFNQIYGPELPQGVTLSPLLDKDDLLTTLHKAGLLQAGTTRF